MAGMNMKKGLNESSGGPDPNEPVDVGPALSELLDHLASELAREYVRLEPPWSCTSMAGQHLAAALSRKAGLGRAVQRLLSIRAVSGNLSGCSIDSMPRSTSKSGQ